MTTPANGLTDEERDFRARLLNSAARLDVPVRASEVAAFAILGSRTARRAPIVFKRFSKDGLVVSTLGLAAGALLCLRSDPVKPNLVVRAEPVVVVARTKPLTNAEPIGSAERRKPSPSVFPVQVPVAKPRAKIVKPLAATSAAAGPALTEPEVESLPDAEQTRLVQRSLEQHSASPYLMAAQALKVVEASSAGASGPALLVWDGDQVGLKASGWSAPDKENKTIEVLAGVGYDQSRGLRWQAQGTHWMGFGWNWFSWWPHNSGTDISRYKALVFRVRVEAPVTDMRPEPNGFMVNLLSSLGSGKRSTRTLHLGHVAPGNLCDGNWHKIAVSLSELTSGDGVKGFDAQRVWEFDFGYWSTQPTSFTAYLDDIGFE